MGTTTAKRGFTLIEVMVATVVMVILVGLVIQITSQVLNVWNRSSGRLSANAEARIAMELLTQDIETAVLRNNGQQWFRVEAPKDPKVTSEKEVVSNQTVSLKLFSPALDRDASKPGDICAIGYRLALQKSYTGATREVYALYRNIVDPDVTFNDVMDVGADSEQASLESGTYWNDDAITDVANYLAGNIVEFKVLVYLDDGSDGEPVNAELTTGELKKTDDGGDYAYGGTGGVTTPINYVDVILKVVSDEGLEILTLPTLSGTGFDTEVDVLRAHGETFTRRIYLPARPL